MKNIKIYCLSFYFFFLYITYTLIYILTVTLVVGSYALFRSSRYRFKRFRRAISWYGKGTMLLPYPFIKLIYENRSDDSVSEPFIYVCNHRSSSDPYLLCVLPDEAIQVVNIWPFRIPVLGFFARRAGYLNIRMMPPEDFFNKAEKILKDNISIIFFPEGTRALNRKMGKFHGSAFRLALRSKFPIVPMCISGSDTVMPKGSPLMRPGKIRIRRLPAITWDDYKDMSVFTLKNRVREIINKELQHMEGAE